LYFGLSTTTAGRMPRPVPATPCRRWPSSPCPAAQRGILLAGQHALGASDSPRHERDPRRPARPPLRAPRRRCRNISMNTPQTPSADQARAARSVSGTPGRRSSCPSSQHRSARTICAVSSPPYMPSRNNATVSRSMKRSRTSPTVRAAPGDSTRLPCHSPTSRRTTLLRLRRRPSADRIRPVPPGGWRATGRLPRRIRSLIPGCQLDAWMPDYAMPERAVGPEEQIWSNIMDPTAAAKLLDDQQ
jgi:hypothetical protein